MSVLQDKRPDAKPVALPRWVTQAVAGIMLASLAVTCVVAAVCVSWKMVQWAFQ